MTTPAATSSGRLLGLDALRGIAAFCVVLMHAHVLFPDTPQLSAKAYLAVDFFFVLSGFVMARTYEARLAQGYGWARFFVARYRRLWPTMFIGGVLFVPFIAEATGDPNPHWLGQIVPNLLLIPSPLSEVLFPVNVPAWSIFFELAANLLHGLVLWRFGLRGVLATSALCAVGLGFAAQADGSLDIGSGHGELLAGMMRVGVTYCMGIALWRAWGQRSLGLWTAAPALIALPVLFWMGGMPSFQTWLFDMAFVILCAPVIMLAGLSLRGGTWAKWLGELSFPLYATHYPVLYWLRDTGFGPKPAILLSLSAAAILAIIQNSSAKSAKLTA